jgi:ABC-type multidrug transport system permease subunit
MSLWFYLEDFFADVPAFWTLIRRMILLTAVLAIVLFVFAILNAPTPIASAVYIGGMFSAIRLGRCYWKRQRQ